MELEGKIKLIQETESVGQNGFKKRGIVITTEEQYPQDILVEFVQDKCNILDNYQIGQDVRVSINLRGREWINPEGVAKYFNSIQGWRIENMTKLVNENEDAFVNQIEPQAEEEDLPF